VARSGSRWRGFVVVTGIAGSTVILLVIGGALRGRSLPTAANVAQLVSVVLAVPPLAVGLRVWWNSLSTKTSTLEQVERAQQALALLVSSQWREEIRIRGLDDVTRLAVRWRLTELDVMDDAGRVDGPRRLRSWLRLGRVRFNGRTDRMDDMAHRFRQLARRRLVILGAPGTGKTTLAVLLLRTLLEDRRPGEPVPVFLSMAGWDPGTEPVHKWLTRRLSENYPALRAADFGPDAPRALVSQRRLLPVLDGLDELPPNVQPQVLSALNAAATTESVILTCRTREYQAAAEMSAGHLLAGGAVIEPRPIKAGDAAAYITNRLVPGQAGGWPKVLATIKAHPNGPVAQALSTPLTLWLLRKVYIDTRSDPVALCDTARFPTADAVAEHLLDNLVHSALSTISAEHDPDDPRYHDHPFRPRHVWDSGDAERWLSFVAHHMSRSGTRDFQWWQLYREVHRRWTSLVGALTVGLTIGVTVGITGGLTIALTHAVPGTLADALIFSFAGGLTGGLVGGLTGGVLLELMKRSDMEPAYADVRLKGRLRLLAGNLAFGLTVGLAVGMITSLGFGLVGGLIGGVRESLVFGLAVGAAGGFTIGLSRWVSTPVTDARPQTPVFTLRRDLELVYVRSVAFGLTLGPAFGIAGALAKGFAGPLAGIEAGVAFGVAGGLVFALTFDLAGASSTYLAALSVLYARRRVPIRLMRFLDDAHRVGLLREAGPAYQFRHAKLQDRLTQTYRDSNDRPAR
jgi:hypothetical protein